MQMEGLEMKKNPVDAGQTGFIEGKWSALQPVVQQ